MSGVLCHIAGIYCMRLAGEWYEYSTYSNTEVCGFIFGTIFFSFSIPSIIYVLKAIFWMKYPVITLIWIYLSFTILSIIGFILSCFTFNGYVYFVWDTTNNLSPVITLTSLISMSLCLLFMIICLIHLFRVYATRSVRAKLSKRMSHFEVPDGGVLLTETTALLENNITSLKSDSIITDDAWEDDDDDDKDDSKEAGVSDKKEEDILYSDTDSEPEYIPTSYKSDMNCYRGDNAFCLFVWVLIPILFFMCTLLPFDFSLFLPSNIATLEEDGVKSYEIRVFFGNNGKYGLNIYPDLLIYYIIFMLVCNISYLSRKSLWFRIEMRKIRWLLPSGVLIKQGEWLLWSILFIFICIWSLYWIFIYDGYDNVLSNHKWLQRITLGIGKIAMLFFSLLLFPITRNSNIWNTVFHTSYEHMIRFHKFFSYCFLICIIFHIILWIIYFSIEGILSRNIIFSTLPYTYNKRNFTIPSMYYIFIFLIIPIFIILSNHRIRTNKYELFYYTHIIGSFILITMVVWHAKSSWYYIIPPIILYVIDQLLLMYKSTRILHIIDIKQLYDERYIQITCKIDEIFASELYEAKLNVYNKTLKNINKKLFSFGQYFWINIASISKYEWHPICCVNSNFVKKECIFIIQKKDVNNVSYNSNEWSSKICNNLIVNKNKNKILNRMMEIKFDGPYGEPIIIDAYRKILIVVGGIGFVSYISFFEYMLTKAICDETQISVDLVWLAKSPKIFLSFKKILKQYAQRFDNDPERLFDIRLFYTQRIQSIQISEIQSSIKLSIEYGRPNLIKELSYIEGLGTFTLIMASGPKLLLKNTQKVAVRYGAHYRQESFVL
eukprot:542423_1